MIRAYQFRNVVLGAYKFRACGLLGAPASDNTPRPEASWGANQSETIRSNPKPRWTKIYPKPYTLNPIGFGP